MRPLRFVPYDDLGGAPSVIVDGSAATGTRLVLSHWPGSPTPAEVRDDLSAQIALRALDHREMFDGIEVVSNNHFDQDGLAGVYALVDPAGAVARRDLVVDVARAGDFGTYESRAAARIAFAIAACADPSTSPLDPAVFAGDYGTQCGRLYETMLSRFAAMLDDPESVRSLWEAEDEHLHESESAIDSGTVTVEEVPGIDLAVVTVPDRWVERHAHRFTTDRLAAVHPTAINNATDRMRILVQQGNRSRLECRYETWVMFVSRPVMARPDLRPLASALNESETGGGRWVADAPGTLTPQLRVGTGESALAPGAVRAAIERYLADAPGAWDPFAGS